MNDKQLFEVMTNLLQGGDPPTEVDFGPWAEPIQTIAAAPVEERAIVFQTLDRFYGGELTRLVCMYDPAADPEPTDLLGSGGTPDIPALPEALLFPTSLVEDGAPWLNDYIAHSREWSPRSYEGYHQMCGLWLLSTIAARRVSFMLGRPRFTNLYQIMAGPSTVYAKTSAAQIAIDFLSAAGLDWLQTPDRSTPQALISYLSGYVPKDYDQLSTPLKAWVRRQFGFAAQRGWFYEEFGTGISAMTRDQGCMAEFRGLLRALDDTPPTFKNLTRSHGAEQVERPYLTMLCNLTEADLRLVARKGAQIWGDGFLARFSFSCPPLGGFKDDPFPPGQAILPPALVTTLRHWHERLGLPQVTEANGQPSLAEPAPITEIHLDEEIRQACHVYNCALLHLAVALDQADLLATYGRLHERALRVAVLLASVEGSFVVELRHWARAQAIAEDWRASLHCLYEQLNQREQSAEADLEQKVLQTVERLGNPTASDIATRIRGVSATEAARIADALVSLGLLVATAKPYGQRLVRRYQPPGQPGDQQP